MLTSARLACLTMMVAFSVACGGAESGSTSSSNPPGSPPSSPPEIDRTGLTLSACSNGGLAAFTPTPAIDYIEERVTSPPVPGADAGKNVFIVDDKNGTPCKTAKDAATCKTALANLSATGWPIGGMVQGNSYLAYTRGDEVKALASIGAIATFLAPIDNLGEAAFFAGFAYEAPVCDGRPNAKADPNGGFDIVVRTGDGCGAQSPIDELLVHVKTNGDLETLQTVRIQDGTPNCSH